VTENESGTETTGTGRANGVSSSDPATRTRSRLIEEALRVADLNALRVTLLQLTGNPELRDMPLAAVPIRNGRVFQTVVHPDHQDRLKEIATEYLSGRKTEVPPAPDAATTLDLLRNFSGADLAEPEVRMAVEGLGFGDFPREPKVSLEPGVSIPEDFHVTIIGAGITGIALAVYLQRSGIPFTIVERHPRLGGTWVANHYPRLRVDVSGLIYQYRFAPYSGWRSQYPTQAEVLEYVDFVVDRYDLASHARVGTSVEEALWDEGTSRWTVRLDDGTSLSSNFVISASGLFSTPNVPDIPGLSTFNGAMFHTADWDDDSDVDGKVVALIGNGSSGTQVMPWLSEHASKVYAFQRTPNWIVPAVGGYDGEMPRELFWLFENLPFYMNWHLYGVQEVSAKGQLGHEVDPEWYAEHGTLSEHNDALRASLEAYIAEKLDGRPDLIEKTTPTQAPLSRRLIVDNGWYEALKQPNVELVTTPISEVDETGIATTDGRHYDLDAVVLGSGFDVGRYFWPVTYKGAAGRTLEDAWRADGPRAYLGMNYPDFPNFFSCYGPNSHPRSGGFHSWTECWARYVTSLIVASVNRGARTVKVRREAFVEFNAALDEEFKKVVWGVVPSGGYYINEHGRPGVHMPYRAHEYYEMLAEPNLSDFDFE